MISMKKNDKTFSCPNCGAPRHGDECEYCGTVFTDPRERRHPYYYLELCGQPVMFASATTVVPMVNDMYAHLDRPDPLGTALSN